VLISSLYGCNIYVKFKPYIFKKLAVNKIQRKIDSLGFKNFKINDEYFLKYDFFVVLKPKEDYYLLKKQADDVLEKLLKLKLFKSYKILGFQQKANYIYFKANDLLNYDISIDDIVEKIKTNNIKNNFIYKNKEHLIDVKSRFKNIDDIKNINLKFKNSNLSTTFGDVFRIEKGIKKPLDTKVVYNNKNTIVLAFSSRFLFSGMIAKFFLKDYEVEFINPNSKKRVEYYLNDNYGIEKTFEYLKSNFESGLFFIGLNLPKIGNFETFDEIKTNRIVGFVDENKKIHNNKEEKPFLKSILGIDYKIDDFKLSIYGLSKKELRNFLLAFYEGLVCDYYWEGHDMVEIILKTNDNFIYSKKMKILFSSNEVIDSVLGEKIISIVRKNGKISKNPKTPFD